jgi:hypothetical protein
MNIMVRESGTRRESLHGLMRENDSKLKLKYEIRIEASTTTNRKITTLAD